MTFHSSSLDVFESAKLILNDISLFVVSKKNRARRRANEIIMMAVNDDNGCTDADVLLFFFSRTKDG